MELLSRIAKTFQLPGDDSGLSSERRAVLTSHLTLATLILSLVYYVIDLTINEHVFHGVFISVALSCILVLVLNGYGYFKLAKVIGLSLFNFILYNLSASQEYSTGVHLHQITAAFGALIIFGFEELVWGWSFTFITVCLYITSYFTSASLIPFRVFTPFQTSVFLVVNLIVFALVSVYLTMMMLRLNFKAERALRNRNEELEKANIELDRFVYSASHDLRAPLNSISGLLNLQRLDPTSNLYADMIQSRVNIMDKFIRDIIDYARNTRTEVVRESVRLKEVVSEIVDVHKITRANQLLKINVEIDDHFELMSDPRRIRIILNNLISNSIKYMDTQKPDPYVSIRAFREADQNIIVIADNGIGIAPAHLPKIFDMFYRATTNATGSGLGLYIVKESLEKINGTVSLNSEPTVGTTFRVTIPV